MIGRIAKVRKRDGRLVDFDETKIADAIHKAGCAVGREDRFLAEELAGVVTLFLEKSHAGAAPGIEEIQDLVEKVLIETGHARMAKAYILYRDRRARAREQVRVHGESQAGPLVGNPVKALVSPWAKARIAEALVREADLDPKVAGQVASSVERKVIERKVARVTTAVIRSLVEAELFERGYGDRVGRQALVGLPRYDIDRLVRGQGRAGWRPAGPRALRRCVADAVLAQYALSEIYSAEVVEAHLEARLHILDAGSPFEWLAAVAAAPRAGEHENWVEARAALVGGLAPLVTRELTVTGVVPERCPWGLEGGPGGAVGCARRLLGHSALGSIEGAGGRFRLVLPLSLLPEDAGAAALTEGVIREHWARFREGRLDDPARLVVHLQADRADAPEARRALLPALAAAAETGRLRIVLDRGGAPVLFTEWLRIPLPEPAGPGALGVGGAVALDLASSPAALSRAREDRLLEELDGLIALALKAIAQKRSFMAGLMADPSGPLYRVGAGAHPSIAAAASLGLVELVGMRHAAARVEREPAAIARLVGRLRSYASVRIVEEGRRSRLRVHPAPDRDGEAAARFQQAAERRGRPLPGPIDDLDPYPLPPEASLAGVSGTLEPLSGTLELRFPREEAPAPEAFYDALCLLARDPRVGSVRLAPWPDRALRYGAADL